MIWMGRKDIREEVGKRRKEMLVEKLGKRIPSLFAS